MFRIGLVGLTTAGALIGQVALAASPPMTRACQAPPLPTPTGTVVTVATEPALRAAVANVSSNTTILIQPGTYNLAAGGGTLYFNRPVNNVTIRGTTDRCDDVVLVGAGMATQGNTPYGIWVGGPTGMTIANLAIRDIYFHPIMFDPNAGTQSPHVYNVHLINAGEQFVKVSQLGGGTNPVPGSGVANGVIEYSMIEYETTLDPSAPAGPNYTNGVDILSGLNWMIRYNVFRNIRAAPGFGLAGPAVLAWRGTINTIVEGNLFLNCQYGIAMGLDPNAPADHAGGIVRNNFFHRTSSQSGDVGIVVNNSANTKVLHNTVVLSGTYPNAIEYRFSATTGVTIRNNLSDASITQRDGALATVSGNVTNAQPNWFANALTGGLHLAALATAAIDKGVLLADVVTDYDGELRPLGPNPDIGADEMSAGTSTPPSAPTHVRVVR